LKPTHFGHLNDSDVFHGQANQSSPFFNSRKNNDWEYFQVKQEEPLAEEAQKSVSEKIFFEEKLGSLAGQLEK